MEWLYFVRSAHTLVIKGCAFNFVALYYKRSGFMGSLYTIHVQNFHEMTDKIS